MSPSASLLQTLHVLWSGEGLGDVFSWLPATVRDWIALWLPRLFKLALAVLLWMAYRRMKARRPDRYVRGVRLIVARGFWWRRWFLPRSTLLIGRVRWPHRLQPLHLLVTGAPGTGKSQTIHGVLAPIRVRGDRAIVSDLGGEAMRGFGDVGDVLLNPFDQRSVAWSPFAEIEALSDADRLAKSMIPDHDGREREWFVYSQALVSSVLRRLWERREQGGATNESLLHALTLAPPAELKALVAGLPAQALFHEGAEKMLASVRGIVGSYLGAYAYLPKDAGPESWSIRRHVRQGQGWLWLPYREDQSAALRPLLAAWLGEAVKAVLSLAPDTKRRYWLLLDEVASIGRVQELGDALTKGRKYGLCAILGLQSVAQLRAAFGDDGAQTLLSCLSTLLILRANDPETAEYASSHLGEVQLAREYVTRSKNGNTRTDQYHVERLVMASEIQGLRNRRGLLRLAEQRRVRYVKVPLVKRRMSVEAFLPKKQAPEAPPAPALALPAPLRPALDADAILGSRER